MDITRFRVDIHHLSMGEFSYQGKEPERTSEQMFEQDRGKKMKNEKDLINAIVNMTALAHSFSSDKREKDLARFILKNYYSVCCYFLNEEDNYASGLNLKSVEIFGENFNKIKDAIQN